MEPEPDVLETDLPDLTGFPLSAILTGVVPGFTDAENAAFRAGLDTAADRVADQIRRAGPPDGRCGC